jgi:hypothetical protein
MRAEAPARIDVAAADGQETTLHSYGGSVDPATTLAAEVVLWDDDATVVACCAATPSSSLPEVVLAA